MEKTCKICKTPKPINDFHKIREGIHRADCKICRNKTGRVYYQQNRERIRKAVRARTPKKKSEETRKKFSDCETSFSDTSHVWYHCRTCINQYNRERNSEKGAEARQKKPAPVYVKKKKDKFCQCEVPVLLMKNSENGIHAYCKTCAKPTKI